MDRSRFRTHLPISILLAAALLIGIITVPAFGESWDEADIRSYSDYALKAYAFLLHPSDLVPFETNLNLYGPGFFAAANLLARLMQAAAPFWSSVTAWHFVYFVTFLVGVLLLYSLARRWMNDLAAFGAALLFLTQPLLWGHAFINPKDIPFMTFFLAAVHFGFRMVDSSGSRARRWIELAIAAVLLGFTTSLRVVGPLAGLLVLTYGLLKNRSSWIRPAGAYILIAGVTAFLWWPYLWAAPVNHLVESLTTMADFPFRSLILFDGQLYKADGLPASYFPTLLAIQLTEPLLILIASGLIVAVAAFIRGEDREPLLLCLGWFAAPAVFVLGSHSPLYDNARQLYFLLPPLFLAAGLALDRLFRYLRGPLIQAAILLIAAAPGILIGARLHPYEYVYYNALVGGTGGAFRHYEMDYWGTSFDELTRQLNAAAPAGANVLVYGPEPIVAARARPDLHVYIPQEGVNPGYDYVILLTRANADQRLCRGTETIYSTGRRGAVFSELRQIPAGTKCQ